jgi:LacI family transcriptional regulator
MRINLLLQKGAALTRPQWHGAAEAVALRRGAELSFVGFYPPFVKNDLKRIARFGIGGMLGMFGRQDYAHYMRRLGLPVVSVYGGRPFAGIPQVGTDDRAIGTMAAEHLDRPGILSFGFFGLPQSLTSRARWSGFATALRRRGHRPVRFRPERSAAPAGRYPFSRLIPWEGGIYAWLESLPKPAAIFCVDDLRAYWIAGACARMGLRVPDEVAILGAGDDEGYVHAVSPHLSSIRLPCAQEGFQAASILLDRMAGKRIPDSPVFLQPEAVVARPSTDILRVANPHAAKAIRFIREARGIGISVDDVSAQSGCCRKVLERLFRQHLGSTILSEIRKEQLEQVRASLRASSASIEQIAEDCGYTSLNHLARDFKKRSGIAPGAYRRQFSLQS